MKQEEMMKGTEKQIKWAEQIKAKNFVECSIKKREGNRNLAAIIIPSLPRLTKADQERDKIRSEWESEAHEEGGEDGRNSKLG